MLRATGAGKTVCVGLMLLAFAAPAMGDEARLSLGELDNKIRGGWAGQMIGVAVGGPTEWDAKGVTYTEPLNWDPALMNRVLRQDDLYVEMTFCHVLDTIGLDASQTDFGVAFGLSRYKLYHANMVGRHNVRRGIKPPTSGHPMYNAHANDIDFQIESDFIGLMSPGMPRTAAEYADRIGHVMNYGDGVYGGTFVSAMYSTAFFENDPRKIVEAGADALHSESRYARVIRDVLDVHKREPNDWIAAWSVVNDKYANRDVCPKGAFSPYCIDAPVNGAFVAIGLLYGGGDFKKTLEIALRCGQDSDCNPATAAGVIGVVVGFDALPEDWQDAANALGDAKYSYTDYSFDSICESTLRRAKRLIAAKGGRVTDDAVVVRTQIPRPVGKLEQWKHGAAVEEVATEDPAWTFEGDWKKWKKGMESNHAGDAAKFVFDGTGVEILSNWSADTGVVEIELDGKRLHRFNTYEDCEPRGGRNQSLYTVWGLKPGKHQVRLIVTGDKSTDAIDAYVRLVDAIVLR